MFTAQNTEGFTDEPLVLANKATLLLVADGYDFKTAVDIVNNNWVENGNSVESLTKISKAMNKASPSPDQVRAARGKLTQAQSAKLVYVNDRTWRKWEGGERKMPAATWELFLIKTH